MPRGRETTLYFAGRVATGGVGLLSLAAFTRLLSPGEFGRYAITIAVAGLISGVVFQWLRQSLVRFGVDNAAARRELLATIGATFLTLVAVSGIVAGIVWALFFGTRQAATMFGLACLIGWSQAWFELTSDAARADFNAVRYCVASVIRAVLCLGLGSAGALLAGGAEPLLLGVGVGYLIGGFVPAPHILPALLRFRDASRVRLGALLRYGMPLSITLGLTFIIDSTDQFMLVALRGEAEVGVYAAAYNLSQFSIGTLITGLSLGAFPAIVRAAQVEGKHAVSDLVGRYLLLLLAIGLPAVVGLALEAHALGPLIIGIYEPTSSRQIITVVAAGIFIGGLRAYCFDAILLIEQRSGLQLAVVFLAAVSNVVLNTVLIPAYGALGAAWATLCAFTLSAVAGATAAHRLLPISIPLVDAAKIALAAGIMAFVLIGVPPESGWFSVVRSTALGAAVYGVAIWALNPQNLRGGLMSILRRLFARSPAV